MPAEKLGRYEIRRHLGKGAMGTVLDGWDPVMERRVAIKMVAIAAGSDSDAEENLARFRREAQAAGRLIHPNIATTHDDGETEKAAYIVMEFVEGRTLHDLLARKHVVPLPWLVGIMADLLAGLQYSHGRGVVHRDIKPSNIMITTEGEVKIVDFGIARLENSSMTGTGIMLGSPPAGQSGTTRRLADRAANWPSGVRRCIGQQPRWRHRHLFRRVGDVPLCQGV